MRPFATRILPVFLVVWAAACSPPPVGVVRGEQLYDNCAPCHGDNGAGDMVLAAPSLAGADAWYLTAQLESFQAGNRGYHYQDAEGLRMKPMARTLKNEGDIESIVAYVVSLPAANPAPTGQGDVAAGGQLYNSLCVACHLADATGMQAVQAPSLNHLSDWYIASSTRKMRDKVRNGTPGDFGGMTMGPMVGALDDTQIENVAAYVQTLN